MHTEVESPKIPIGVSACLLGQNVRFNGANSHKGFITKTLADYFELVHVCPEVSAGLGVPREPVYLEARGEKLIVRQHKTGLDLTDTLTKACERLVAQFPRVYGFILKKGSPSCGVERVKIYNENHQPLQKKTEGVFVKALKATYPHMPIEDEGRLNDSGLKEHFIKRVYLFYDVQQSLMTADTIKACLQFHERHKMMLRLHKPLLARKMGQLLAEPFEDLEGVKEQYAEYFYQALEKVASRGQHVTVLQRILRSINKEITVEQRANFQAILKKYHDGLVPLAVPVEMIRHYLKQYDIPLLASQSYLFPYPDSLGLMSEV